MKDISWHKEDRTLQVRVPARPKKMTGTRFASILGLNPWSTPFEMWCEITRTYEKPFEDTIYTKAGKIIEPKQAEYMRKSYFMRNLIKPADVWGDDYFKKTWGDFFPADGIFGGMWDYILRDDDGKPSAVLEMKTTKRAEDWQGDVPEYYALQGALYAYLLGCNQVIMVCSFLQDGDYDNPDAYVPDNTNTVVYPFQVSERYPFFQHDYIDKAERWWLQHVMTGISPEYDEKKDKEILDALRKDSIESLDADLVAEAERLKAEIDANKEAIAGAEKRYKAITDAFKSDAMHNFGNGITKVDIAGSKFTWTVSETVTNEIDVKALEADGLLQRYSKPKITYRMSVKKKGDQ